MRGKNWRTRVLWFVLGLIVASSFGLASAHRRTPMQLTLEERVTRLEKDLKALAEVVSYKQDEIKQRSNDR